MGAADVVALASPTGMPQTDQGATDFVAFWFRVVNAGYVTGTQVPIAAASGPDCTACSDYERDLASLVVDGARTQDEPFLVSDLRSSGADSGVAVVTMTYVVRQTSVHRPGMPDEVSPGSPAVTVRAAVEWTDTGWQMGEIGL